MILGCDDIAGVFIPGHRCPDIYLHPWRNEDYNQLTQAPRRIYNGLATYERFIILSIAREDGRGYYEDIQAKQRKYIDHYIIHQLNGKHEDAEFRPDLIHDKKEGEEGYSPINECEREILRGIYQDIQWVKMTDAQGHYVDAGIGFCSVVIRPDMYVGYVGDRPGVYLEGVLESNSETFRMKSSTKSLL